jgi:hypothetical protein
VNNAYHLRYDVGNSLNGIHASRARICKRLRSPTIKHLPTVDTQSELFKVKKENLADFLLISMARRYNRPVTENSNVCKPTVQLAALSELVLGDIA